MRPPPIWVRPEAEMPGACSRPESWTRGHRRPDQRCQRRGRQEADTQRLLAALRAGARGAADIAADSGLAPSRVRDLLARAVEGGLVVRVERGVYECA